MKHFVDKMNEIAFPGNGRDMLVDAKKMFIVEEIKENIVVSVEREVIYAQMFFTAEAALEWKKARELENDEENVYYNMFVDDTAQSVQVDC